MSIGYRTKTQQNCTKSLFLNSIFQVMLSRNLINNLKNIPGWRTKRRLIVFCVDDYGNVRLNSKLSKQSLLKSGLNLKSRFDSFDAMETTEDLEVLFETLSSVKDSNNRPAVFTAFSMPSNLDFESIIQNNYEKCSYELLPETFKKLESLQPDAYKGIWSVWKNGIKANLIYPQFHGKEHFNHKVISELLSRKSPELISNIQNRSLAGINNHMYNTISWTAAFDFWDVDENKQLAIEIEQGIADFKTVFGISPVSFTPPATVVHNSLLPVLERKGIKVIDAKTIGKNHRGFGSYGYNYNFTGKKTGENMRLVVRNVMFEPTLKSNLNCVQAAIDQIEAAFRWGKPAVISSHRVNFAGLIDIHNRTTGIETLRLLLKTIVRRWPDAEFISTAELSKIMEEN